MNSSLELYKNIAYGVLAILFIIIIFSCFNYKQRVVQNLMFRENTNVNSNIEGFNSNIEGFTNSKLKENKYNKDENIIKIIENKLRALTEEIGGSEGKKEVKSILTNTKKIINLECAKCMMTMLDENKGGKSIDFDKLLDEENDENCTKCKKYTELSSTINSMIDNL
jgi:ribosomal protein L44E